MSPFLFVRIIDSDLAVNMIGDKRHPKVAQYLVDLGVEPIHLGVELSDRFLHFGDRFSRILSTNPPHAIRVPW